MFTIVLIFFIVALVAVFSVQNAAPVTITFLFWKFEASLAVIIFLCVLSGIAVTVIIKSSGYIKKYFKKAGEKN